MTLSPIDIESLKTALSWWEKGEYFFAGLVVIACFGEYVGEFKNWLTAERKEQLRKTSTIVLIAALSLELVCLIGTNIVSGRITSEYEQHLLVQGPRWRLLETGKDKFVATLQPFAGQRYIIVECGENPPPESYKLKEDLETFLHAANWELVPLYATWSSCSHGTGNGATSDGGNLVAFNAHSSPRAQDAGLALCDVLNKLSIFTTSYKASPTPIPDLQKLLGDDSPFVRASKDPTAIFVLVGLNPMASGAN
jgi:hypothetical protein